MQTRLSYDNYEQIFFDLLENNYTYEEALEYRRQIDADTFLSFEWKNWQSTLLKKEADEYAQAEVTFFAELENLQTSVIIPKDKKRVVPIFFKYTTVAACLFLFLLFAIPFAANKHGHTAHNFKTKKAASQDLDNSNSKTKSTNNEDMDNQTIASVLVIDAPENNNQTSKRRNVYQNPITTINLPMKKLVNFDMGVNQLNVPAAIRPIVITEPKPTYTFTVLSVTDIPKKEIKTLGEIDEQGIKWRTLLKNSDISLVIVKDQPFIKITKEDQNQLLVALN